MNGLTVDFRWFLLITEKNSRTANKQIQVIGTKYWGGLLLSEPGLYYSEENRKSSEPGLYYSEENRKRDDSLRWNHLKRRHEIWRSQKRRIKQLHKQHYQIHLLLTRLTLFLSDFYRRFYWELTEVCLSNTFTVKNLNGIRWWKWPGDGFITIMTKSLIHCGIWI